MAGLRLQCGPFLSQLLNAPTSVLGEAVLSLFAAEERLVPHPADWKAHALPRLLAAGVKTESTFQRDAAMVSITATTDGYWFEPTMNEGVTGSMNGFHPLPNLSSTVSSTSNAEILGSVLS